MPHLHGAKTREQIYSQLGPPDLVGDVSFGHFPRDCLWGAAFWLYGEYVYRFQFHIESKHGKVEDVFPYIRARDEILRPHWYKWELIWRWQPYFRYFRKNRDVPTQCPSCRCKLSPGRDKNARDLGGSYLWKTYCLHCAGRASGYDNYRTDLADERLRT